MLTHRQPVLFVWYRIILVQLAIGVSRKYRIIVQASTLDINCCAQLPDLALHWWSPTGRNSQLATVCSYLGSLCACTLVEHSALWMPLLSAFVQSSSPWWFEHSGMRMAWCLYLSHKCRASRQGIQSCAQLARDSALHWRGLTGRNSQLATVCRKYRS